MASGLLIPQFTPEVDLGDYATQSWVNTQLSGYSKSGHMHNEYSLTSHTHSASDVGAAASSHNHSASNITSGTLSATRGGTGVTSLSALKTSLAYSASDVGAAAASHVHSASDITSGTLSAARGGTGYTSLTNLKSALGVTDQYTISTPMHTASNGYADASTRVYSSEPITATLTVAAKYILLFAISAPTNPGLLIYAVSPGKTTEDRHLIITLSANGKTMTVSTVSQQSGTSFPIQWVIFS